MISRSALPSLEAKPSDDHAVRVAGRQGTVIVLSFLPALLADHAGNYGVVEKGVIITAGLFFVAAMLTFVDCGEVTAVLKKNFLNLHGVISMGRLGAFDSTAYFTSTVGFIHCFPCEGVEGKGAAVPAADGAGHGLNSVL